MASVKRYFWLKLFKGFFKRHDIKVLLKKDKEFSYCLFYLMLLLESIDHDGSLRFSEDIPYDAELLSDVFDYSADDIQDALALYQRLGLVEELPDGTIFMNKLEGMVGSETQDAERKRRERKTDKDGQCPKVSEICPTEKEKEKELDKDIDIDSSLMRKKSSSKSKSKHEPSFDIEKAKATSRDRTRQIVPNREDTTGNDTDDDDTSWTPF